MFGRIILKDLFLVINTTSETLQASDNDLSAASFAIENLKEYVKNQRCNKGFDTIHATAISFCSALNVNTEEELKQKQTKKLPSASQQSVFNSFVTRAANALQSTSQNEDIKN